jgi:thiol-disulfide isomerase/thioredoxin
VPESGNIDLRLDVASFRALLIRSNVLPKEAGSTTRPWEVTMNRFWAPFLVLAVALPLPSLCQTVPSDRPDPAKLIREVREHYASAKTYRIEAIRETEWVGDMSRQWDKEILSAAAASGNRYRFEGHAAGGWAIKISDGKTEWLFDPLLEMYTQINAPNPGPVGFNGPFISNRLGLLSAQGLTNELSKAPAELLDPVYLEDEALTLNGREIACYVLHGRGRYRGGARDTITEVTFWIDKQNHLIRKVHEHQSGSLIENAPYEHSVYDRVSIYPSVELNPASLPDSMFKFDPPAKSELVKEFPDFSKPVDRLTGTKAPELKLRSGNNTVLLSSYRGKPVLLEFWATWCEPCIVAIPSLKKIHAEAAPKGLAMLGIDEDEDEKTALDYLAKQNEGWPNYHDGDGEIERAFAFGGVPKLILVDASGKIVYAQVGFSESQVRAAIAKLGPEYAELNKMQEAESSPKK